MRRACPSCRLHVNNRRCQDMVDFIINLRVLVVGVGHQFKRGQFRVLPKINGVRKGHEDRHHRDLGERGQAEIEGARGKKINQEYWWAWTA